MTYANINPAGPAPTITTFSTLLLLPLTTGLPLMGASGRMSRLALGDIFTDFDYDVVRIVEVFNDI